jgi:hypothetical protein
MVEDEDFELQIDAPSAPPEQSAVLPVKATPPLARAPVRRAPTGGTQVLPAGKASRSVEPKGTPPRKKGDTRKPLEFTHNQMIGRFGLIREIARGGMGQVFLARDTKLGRKVAIKFLLHDDPNFVQRFLIEARATALCTHENIVTIFEVGEHEGLPYMVLEYLEGKTLSDVLDGKPSPHQFVELMIPVARALERAHEHGIVHRDLKPSNIFVTDRGQVKVLDFGVARLMNRSETEIAQARAAFEAGELDDIEDSSVTFTRSNSIVGTLPYMSPEQWGADTVDHLSDLWAFGIMFWRALTGVHPAGSLSPDKLRARMCDLDTPLPSIAERDPALPRPVVAIVDRCLEKRKGMRYQSATELLRDLQAFVAPDGVRSVDDVCPYRGLAAFGEGDAKYFFGRSAEIRTALTQLETWPLLAVIGPSGVGKSSFVHAGLVPAMRATGANWKVRVLRPGRTPLQNLAGVLDDSIETGQVGNDLVAQLGDAPGLFGEMLRKAAGRRKHKVAIVVDQLEELFTLSDDDEVRKLFLAALLAAADDPSAPVRVVLSMRADFLDRLAGHKHFLAELSRGLFFLSAPDHENLRETLVRPAELAGYAFEDPWIVDDMMATATSRGALPLLQFAATRLWDARDRQRKKLTVSAYNAMGGVGGAFARHADEVAAAIPASSQILLRAIMTRLVTPEGTRAVVDHAELLGLTDDRAEIERVLDQLVRGRLVLLHTDPAHGSSVEIVHEVLITEWPTLARWLEDNQALRGFMQEIRQATRQWLARDRANDVVWRGATAQEALALAKRHVLDLSATEREFLAAVRSQAGRGRRRKIYVFASIFTVLGLVFAGGTVAYVRIAVSEQEALDAKAQVQRQLDDVRAAEARREAAEHEKQSAEAVALKAKDAELRAKEAEVKANAGLQLSRDELERKNVELETTAEEAKREKVKAQELARVAAANADAAKKAAEDAKAQKARAEQLYAAEKARREQLEKEKSKIATDLKAKGGL